MNYQTDLDINRAVRRVLVKHWIDLGRLSVRTIRGSVYVSGELQRIEGRMDPIGAPIIEAMLYEIQRAPGVSVIRAHFENWINDGGRWRPTQRVNLQASDSKEKPGRVSGASGARGSAQ